MEQLGEVFTEIERLPDHAYCLLAAFALKGARKRTEADDLLGDIAANWSSDEGLKITPALKGKASAVLSNRKFVEPLIEVIGKHAYVTTVMLAALAWARREGGVLAPAQFVWLRGEHRELWYPLNNIGRRAFHVEAAGAMAHYQSELQAGRALLMPRLDAAVVAVVQYLSEVRPRIPELENKPSVLLTSKA
jgi:intracellular multiplication protein IcmP